MKTYITVHAIATNNKSEYLVLQRANNRTSPAKWNCVTGYIKDRESAEEAALRELKEETNLTGEIIKTTEPFWIDDKEVRWLVVTSLIKVEDASELQINEHESQNYKWIKASDPIVDQSKGLKTSLSKLGII
ncbi:hypothetical protein A2Z22_05080 [Candidatus Woesebacteria bacterium RBG_16_34_12]|uniref:Nudix hydrolase domain-containing protein n=1 Tax=Candidatus Woesebacteria bacterium RBG_16_34_12 TaxID=1802480 RepID=A0A1F7X8G5_9BACT|nr:MAG: hypothetical protein A2Z22_05080 [Candidatus Woesebacteria bacterium RBG_16_34_12]